MELQLNEAQTKAYVNLVKFLSSPKTNEFILLGPAGSGKTTVIVNAFNSSAKRVAFCAFTNKATQVLKKIADKFSINFAADFMTIHSLLMLEQKYLDNEREIAFTFDKTKVEHLKNYDVLIFDECSTISAELYKYIREAQEYIKFTHSITMKLIFLGDYWQLPPVGEDKSIIFATCVKEKWPISKLEKVMRSANELMGSINDNMLEWIPKFKLGDTDAFIRGYPYNLVPKNTKSYLQLDSFLDEFLNTWRTKTPDTVILTYSRSNCDKTNQSIQDKLDDLSSREIPENREMIKFYPGDRCCLDRPINIFTVARKKNKLPMNLKDGTIVGDISKELTDMLIELDNDVDPGAKMMPVSTIPIPAAGSTINILPSLISESAISMTTTLPQSSMINDSTTDIDTVSLNEPTGETLYNGEIFDIISTETVNIITPLNKLKGVPKYFEGQLLTIVKINDASTKYEILHIPEPTINETRKIIRSTQRRMFYIQVMSDFIKKYPKLDYGYCITVYKSQGSEWDTVFVNLNSIKWSIVGPGGVADAKKKAQLFKTTYTAISRASSKIYCVWSR
jgi:hypothetical protein